jgi:hypothetical protein
VEALGPILILLSIPLVLRWVPPNRIYGFRVPPVYRNRSVWYDANALAGKHYLWLGVLMVALEFVLPNTLRVPVLRAVGIAGLAGVTIADWITASRWSRERGDGR